MVGAPCDLGKDVAVSLRSGGLKVLLASWRSLPIPVMRAPVGTTACSHRSISACLPCMHFDACS